MTSLLEVHSCAPIHEKQLMGNGQVVLYKNKYQVESASENCSS